MMLIQMIRNIQKYKLSATAADVSSASRSSAPTTSDLYRLREGVAAASINASSNPIIKRSNQAAPYHTGPIGCTQMAAIQIPKKSMSKKDQKLPQGPEVLNPK